MTRSRTRFGLLGVIATGIVGWLAVAGPGSLEAQSPVARPVRYFIPDGIVGGTGNAEPFSAGSEMRFQVTLDPTRLPRVGGNITALYLIPDARGSIDVADLAITLGHGTSTVPSPLFDLNLNNFVPVYRGPFRSSTLPSRAIKINLATVFPYDGRSPLVVDFKLRGVRSGVKVYRAPRSVNAIFAKGTGSFSAQTATSGVVPGIKIGAEFASVAASVECLTEPDIGEKLQLSFQATSRIGDAFIAGAAFSSAPGIDIGEYTIPLAPDALFFSVWQLPGVFQNFTGQVGLAGFGSGAVNIPNEPALIGTSFVVAFVTHTPGTGITSVSMESWITIGANCAVP